MKGVCLKRLFPLLLIFSLTACEGLPKLNFPGAGYRPLGSAVAETAAPLPDGARAEDALYCRVSKGNAKFGERWEDFKTADFYLPPDMRIAVTLASARGGGELTFQSWYSRKTQEMLFCPVVDGPPDKKIPCAAIFALDDDLNDGIKRTFDIPHAVEGGVITCAHDAQNLKN